MASISPALLAIRDVLSNPDAQEDLITLYQRSQSEHKRNGKVTPDVGVSREKDLVATLAYNMTEVDYKIDNSLPEDVLVCKEKISIKNFSDSASFKAIWTSDNVKVKEAIESLCNPNYDHPHLIAIHIIKKQTFVIYLITNTTIKSIIADLGEQAFNSPTGSNNRGVSFSTDALKRLKDECFDKITISNIDLDFDVEDPIDKRKEVIATDRAERLLHPRIRVGKEPSPATPVVLNLDTLRDSIDRKGYTVAQLKIFCTELGVKVSSKAKKSEIRQLLMSSIQ